MDLTRRHRAGSRWHRPRRRRPRSPGVARAQTPKRGGTLSLRLWDPPHFDPHLTISYKTNVCCRSPTAGSSAQGGPGRRPRHVPPRGRPRGIVDPAQRDHLRVQAPPGRALPPQAAGERPRADRRGRAYSLRAVHDRQGQLQRVHAEVGRQGRGRRQVHRAHRAEGAVRLVPRHAGHADGGAIIAKEAVEKFGDLKKPEAVVGTGPWMLDSYRPNRSFTLVRHPGYFVPGLPYIDRVEVTVDEDNASRMAAFLSGKYDLGWETRGQHQPRGLGADQGLAQEQAAQPADAGVPHQRDVTTSRCARTRSRSATSACARPCRWPSTARASSTRPSRAPA